MSEDRLSSFEGLNFEGQASIKEGTLHLEIT
jgi:hypothetical protein